MALTIPMPLQKYYATMVIKTIVVMTISNLQNNNCLNLRVPNHNNLFLQHAKRLIRLLINFNNAKAYYGIRIYLTPSV
jgi:hypothetical protein